MNVFHIGSTWSIEWYYDDVTINVSNNSPIDVMTPNELTNYYGTD